MRRRTLAAVTVVVVLTGFAWAGSAPASAWADGGQSIATAPSVVFGQQEFGSTATGGYLTLGCGRGYRSYWDLPVTVGDLVTIDWESSMPSTEMVVSGVGTTDFNLLDTTILVEQALSGSSRDQFQFTAPQSGPMPLWFRSCEDNGATPGPYTFTATDQHGLVLDLQSRVHIRRKTVIRAAADLLSDAPAPDGLTFYLTAHWANHRRARFAAVSQDGKLRFPVRLPSITEGHHVSFTVSRPADTEFLEDRSAPLSVTVARPTPRRCGRGFRRRWIDGRVRCVKFEQR